VDIDLDIQLEAELLVALHMVLELAVEENWVEAGLVVQGNCLGKVQELAAVESFQRSLVAEEGKALEGMVLEACHKVLVVEAAAEDQVLVVAFVIEVEVDLQGCGVQVLE